MKKLPIIALLALLVGAILVSVTARQPQTPSGPIFSVAQVYAGMTAHRRAWMGRTILVRGKAYYCSPTGAGDCVYEWALLRTDGGVGIVPLSLAPESPIVRLLRRLPLVGSYLHGPAHWTGLGTFRVRLHHAPGCRYGPCWEGLVLDQPYGAS